MKKFQLLIALMGALLAVGCGDKLPEAVAADIDVQALLTQLKDSDRAQRVDACVKLSEGLQNAAPALDALIEVVRSDKDAQVREMAAYAIYQMGEEIAKPAMVVVKERFEKERAPGVRSMFINLWNMLEPETSPVKGNAGPQP